MLRRSPLKRKTPLKAKAPMKRGGKRKHEATSAEKAHMGRVAKYGCIVLTCRKPATVHHLTGAGMGLRSKHYETIPLCPYHHQQGPFGRAVHNGTETFEKKYGSQEAMLGLIWSWLHRDYPEIYGQEVGELK